LGLLQADDVGPPLIQPGQQPRHPLLDRVHVPGRYPHPATVARCGSPLAADAAPHGRPRPGPGRGARPPFLDRDEARLGHGQPAGEARDLGLAAVALRVTRGVPTPAAPHRRALAALVSPPRRAALFWSRDDPAVADLPGT